jgi:hypothetical protein
MELHIRQPQKISVTYNGIASRGNDITVATFIVSEAFSPDIV